jgi:hypothetical protein
VIALQHLNEGCSLKAPELRDGTSMKSSSMQMCTIHGMAMCTHHVHTKPRQTALSNRARYSRTKQGYEEMECMHAVIILGCLKEARVESTKLSRCLRP